MYCLKFFQQKFSREVFSQNSFFRTEMQIYCGICKQYACFFISMCVTRRSIVDLMANDRCPPPGATQSFQTVYPCYISGPLKSINERNGSRMYNYTFFKLQLYAPLHTNMYLCIMG